MTDNLQQLRQAAEKKKSECRKLENRISDLEEKEELPKVKKKYEGKYFKYQNRYNSEAYWWKYYHVLEVQSVNMAIVNTFESPTDHYQFRLKDTVYLNILANQITKREYDREAKRFIRTANKIITP